MIARIASLHSALLFTCLATAALLLIISLVGAARNQPAAGGAKLARGITLLLLLAQCVLGAMLYFAGARAVQMPLHVLYGVVALAALPLVAALGSEGPPRSVRLREALASVFLIAVLLRTLETARP